MNIEALYHRANPNDAFAYKLNELHIRFRTAKDDVDEIHLYYGVKFDWANKKFVKMDKIHSDEYFDYYQYNIIENDMRLGYYFKIVSGKDELFYTEAGIRNEFDDKKAHFIYFHYPSIHKIDLISEPKWLKDAMFYQIFVERFENGNDSISPEGIVAWDSIPTPKSFHGGDLIGITQRLDYIKDLGVNALYFTPIFLSDSNHKYDTIDYMEIDPHFGTKEDFKELVDQAHSKGIRIILDAVLNHCSEKFEPFQDVLKYGEESEYKDWFIINDFPIKRDPPNYETFAFVPYMPRFNTSNEEVKRYLYSVIEYWTKTYKIDGWRLDVADEPDHWFWRDFRRKVKGINKDLFIVGENWHDAMLYLMGDQFDSVMNYSVTNLAIEYFAKEEISTDTFSKRLITLLMKYADPINRMMLNLLDSHDTERFLFLCNEDKSKLKMAAAFLFGYIGIPCTYYGTEIGMTGGYDPGCRRGFNWNKESWDHDLYEYYKRLISIRNSEEVLKNGTIRFLSDASVFIMERSWKGEKIYIVINQTDSVQNIPIEILSEVNKDLIRDSFISDNLILPKSAYFLK